MMENVCTSGAFILSPSDVTSSAGVSLEPAVAGQPKRLNLPIPMSLFRNCLGMCFLGCILLCGCAGKQAKRGALGQKKKPNEPETLGAQQSPLWRTRLGRVILVNRVLDFVLIDAGTSPAPEPGTRLRAYAGGELSAELAVSVHQQRPYLIADIVSGDPRVSDMVVPFTPNSTMGGERRTTTKEREAGPPSEETEKRQRQASRSISGDLTQPGWFSDPTQNQDIPQGERRPPPAPQSLLTPSQVPAESESIIPGLPVLRKSTTR
jgi:hypothetical protein